MTDKRNHICGERGYVSFALLFCLVFLIYSNTFDAPWHLDDYHNIAQNSRVQIGNVDIDSLKKPLSPLIDNGKFDRPLAFFTFALNWYFGRQDPTGYHIVNISIHFLAGIFLFLTISSLFQTPRLRSRYDKEHVHFISLLSAVLWAANPIQTQAVTYIVQRMASMAAMFYILSLFLYVQARLSTHTYKIVILIFGCALSFFCGFASKENAITLPFAILMVEALFFQDLSQRRTRNILAGISIAGFLIILGLGSILIIKGNPLSVLNYGSRYFSPVERLLTEPRIILYYLSQIFYPAPTRLSIDHDVIISTSLFYPWTTLPIIVVISAAIVLAVTKVRKWPILSFAILFFFLNHVIESSVIGLELIFEHRNYLPSMFLFLPVAVGIRWLLDYYHRKKTWMYLTLIGFISLMIVGYGMGTYVRNMSWSSGKFLWEDAMAKAPKSARPLHNLARDYYQRIGDNTKALELYFRALDLSKTNISQESVILNNIAGIYYERENYKMAAEYWEMATKSYSDYSETWYRLALAQTKLGEMDNALNSLAKVFTREPEHFGATNLKGIIFLSKAKNKQALTFFRKCLKLNPNSKVGMVNVAAALTQMGQHGKAEWYFKNLLFKLPGHPVVILWLAKIQSIIGNEIAADGYIDKLIDYVGFNKLALTLAGFSKNSIYADSLVIPHLDESLMRLILKRLEHRSYEIDRQLTSF